MAPTTKISTPINMMNCEKIADNPNVNVPDDEEMSTPILLLKNSKNSVDATLNVKVAMVRLV